MAKPGFELRGTKAMKRKIEAIAKRHPDKIVRALYIEGEFIMTRSKRDFVPVDDSPLKTSGHVQPPVRKGKDVEVGMVFGGSSAPYALAVHEHPSVHSPPTWKGKPIEGIRSVRTRKPWSLTGRGPKFLERPMKAAIRGMAERIAKEVEP